MNQSNRASEFAFSRKEVVSIGQGESKTFFAGLQLCNVLTSLCEGPR